MSKTNAPTSLDELAVTEQWLDSLDPAVTPARDARHLRAVGEALIAVESASAQLEASVAAAHAAGESWAMIGMVLGISKQAAHRKFGAGPAVQARVGLVGDQGHIDVEHASIDQVHVEHVPVDQVRSL